MSKPTTYQQYLLQDGKRFMHCWLPNTHTLKVGNVVKLKKVEGAWTIKHVWSTVLKHVPDTTWRVGGIDG